MAAGSTAAAVSQTERPQLAEVVPRSRLKWVRRANWFTPRGLAEVLRHMTKVEILLFLYGRSFSSDPDGWSDPIEPDPERKLGADDVLGERLGCSGREIRAALKELGPIVDVQDHGRGRGFRLRSHPERIEQLRVRLPRQCRPRAQAEPAQEPEPERIPVSLHCPAGVPRCPVQSLVQIRDGTLTNSVLPDLGCAPVRTNAEESPPPVETPGEPGTTVPTSPPGADPPVEPGTTVPTSPDPRIAKLRDFIAEHLHVKEPPTDGYLGQLLHRLGPAPLELLLQAALANRTKIRSAGFLAKLIPGIREDYEHQRQRPRAERKTERKPEDQDPRETLRQLREELQDGRLHPTMRAALEEQLTELEAALGADDG